MPLDWGVVRSARLRCRHVPKVLVVGVLAHTHRKVDMLWSWLELDHCLDLLEGRRSSPLRNLLFLHHSLKVVVGAGALHISLISRGIFEVW